MVRESIVLRMSPSIEHIEGELVDTFFEAPHGVRHLVYTAAHFKCAYEFLKIYREEGLKKAEEFLEERMSGSEPEIVIELEEGAKRTVLRDELAEIYIGARKELKPLVERAFEANLTESAIHSIISAYAAGGLKGAEEKLNYYLDLDLTLMKDYVSKEYVDIVIGSPKRECYGILSPYGVKCSETLIEKAEKLPDNPFRIAACVTLKPGTIEKILDMSREELEELYEAVRLVAESTRRDHLAGKLEEAIAGGKVKEFIKKLSSRRKSYRKRQEKLDEVYNKIIREYDEKGYVKTRAGYILSPYGVIEIVTYDGRYLKTEFLPGNKEKSVLYSLTRGHVSTYFKEEKPSEEVLERVKKIDESLAVTLKLNYS